MGICDCLFRKPVPAGASVHLGGAVWISRQDVAADRVFRVLQLHVQDAGDPAETREEIERRPGGPARVAQELPRLARLPELGLPVELALANGFFAPGSADQPTLGFHMTIPQDTRGGFTEAGERLIAEQDGALSKGEETMTEEQVEVEFEPLAVVALPTVFRLGDTVADRLEDKAFRALHTVDGSSSGGGKDQVQLTQVCIGGNVKVRNLKKELLWSRQYERGKFGNPHVTVLAQRCDIADARAQSGGRLEEAMRRAEMEPPLSGEGSLGDCWRVLQILNLARVASEPPDRRP